MALFSLLDDTEHAALFILAGSDHSMSGRALSYELGVAPTTASVCLGRLLKAGLVLREQQGRSFQWRLNPVFKPMMRRWRREF